MMLWHAGDGHWNAAKATKNAKNNAWGAHLRMMDLNAGSCAQKMQKKPPAGLKMAFLPALMDKTTLQKTKANDHSWNLHNNQVIKPVLAIGSSEFLHSSVY